MRWAFEISSDFKNIKEVSGKILQCLRQKKIDEAFTFDIRLACEEAIINAIQHGNRFNRDKAVRISCQITDKALVVAVEDEGPGFNYKDLPDPTQTENLSKPTGRGLFIIQHMMDKVEFNAKGNKIIMTKFFKK